MAAFTTVYAQGLVAKTLNGATIGTGFAPMTPAVTFVSVLFGSDTTGDGSMTAPYKTIQHAINQAGAPPLDITYVVNVIDGGTYPENLVVPNGFNINAPGALLAPATGDALTIADARAYFEDITAGAGGRSIVSTAINGGGYGSGAIVDCRVADGGNIENTATGNLRVTALSLADTPQVVVHTSGLIFLDVAIGLPELVGQGVAPIGTSIYSNSSNKLLAFDGPAFADFSSVTNYNASLASPDILAVNVPGSTAVTVTLPAVATSSGSRMSVTIEAPAAGCTLTVVCADSSVIQGTAEIGPSPLPYSVNLLCGLTSWIVM
jgi:hypothetical protein